MGCECVYHLLNLIGDDIAAGEVSPIENGAEKTLGQEVLDQHLLNRGFGEIGVDRLTTFLMKSREGGGKLTVGPPFLFDQFCQAVPKCRHSVFELRDRRLPFDDMLGGGGQRRFRGFLSVALASVKSVSSTCVGYSAKGWRVLGFGKGCCRGDSLPQTCAALGWVGCRGYPLPPNSRATSWKLSINAPSTTIRSVLTPLAPLDQRGH